MSLEFQFDLEVIIGLPQERDEDFEATIKYINKNKEYINYMTINEFFLLYPIVRLDVIQKKLWNRVSSDSNYL